ncbi:uncharacterized protein LOC143154898 [Ptiloglossa arizonensis]|uniref:uncharacterized protein LOC143154898 n=1 Tax=Ptiloglossa arizonensis TaxID=3350558 RepID=UPI003FA04AF3
MRDIKTEMYLSVRGKSKKSVVVTANSTNSYVFPPFPHYRLVRARAATRDSAVVVAADPWCGVEQSCPCRVSQCVRTGTRKRRFSSSVTLVLSDSRCSTLVTSDCPGTWYSTDSSADTLRNSERQRGRTRRDQRRRRKEEQRESVTARPSRKTGSSRKDDPATVEQSISRCVPRQGSFVVLPIWQVQ